MKWVDVQITDEDNNVYTGERALKFVEDKCKPIQIKTKDNDLIEAYSGAVGATTDNKVVRSYLFSQLKRKVKTLRFLTGDASLRTTLPLARAVSNVVNVTPTKLKVEFIYKQNPLNNDQPKLFKELPIKVTSSLGVSMNAKDGVADFKIVAPGKHKLTIAFDAPNQNKFDFSGYTKQDTGKTEREVELDSGDNYTLVIEIVPLYTKVVFVGHCLVTIAKQIYHKKTTEWESKYTGLTPEIKDIEERVKLLGKIIEKASGLVGDKEDELKVFVAPECFFLGPNGAYSIEALSSLIKKLQNLVMDPKWEHWMFAFGTVNSVYEDEGKFSELLNYTPVIRGGFKSRDKAPDYTKLIQKTFYSAEMPFKSELKNPTDEQFYGEIFRKDFGATEYEYIFGRQVRELLEITWDDKKDEWVSSPGETLISGKKIDAVCIEKNWKPGEWSELKGKALNQLKTRGMTCVVRDVRDGKGAGWDANRFKELLLLYVNSKTKKVPENALIPKTSNTFSPENFTFYCARKPGPLLKEGELPQNLSISFGLEICADHSQGRLKGARSEVDWEIAEKGKSVNDKFFSTKNKKTVVEKALKEITAETQGLEEIVQLLEQDKNSVEAAKQFKELFSVALDPNTVKEFQQNKIERLAEIKIQKEDIEKELEKATNEKNESDSKKKLRGEQKALDIQLVPSAGMSVAPMNVATKPDGYFFNCNGWNPSSAQTQSLIQRGAKIIKVENNDYPTYHPDTGKTHAGHNPLYYHSELLKTPMKPVATSSVTILTEDVSKIFAEGPGQLHIYPPQDLKK